MGVLATNLSKLVLGVDIPSSSGKKRKLDAMQKMAEKLSDCTFPSLHSHCETSAVGLLCSKVT